MNNIRSSAQNFIPGLMDSLCYRGGSWPIDSYYAQIFMRAFDGPGYFNINLGFRIVLKRKDDEKI